MTELTSLQTSNLTLWDAGSRTDPNDTKSVNKGYQMTVIDAYSQIKKATELFGPAGVGWGWQVMRLEYTVTNQIATLIRLWHGNPEQFIEQWGQCSLYVDKAEKRKDDDCYKKCVTDGLTKCLSYLGFNSDIFLGTFDASKYVADNPAKPAAPPKVVAEEVPLDVSEASTEEQPWHEWVADAVGGLKDMKSLGDLKWWYGVQEPTLASLKTASPDLHAELNEAISTRKKELSI